MQLQGEENNVQTEVVLQTYVNFRSHFEAGKKAAEGTAKGWVKFFTKKSDTIKGNYSNLRTQREPTVEAFLELPMWELYARQENFDTAEMYRLITPGIDSFRNEFRSLGLHLGIKPSSSLYEELLEKVAKEYGLYGEGEKEKIIEKIITKIQNEQGSVPVEILEMALLKKPKTAIAIAEDFQGSVNAMTFEQFVLDLHNQEFSGSGNKIVTQKREMTNKDKAGSFILRNVVV